jgi:hypothetical protein
MGHLPGETPARVSLQGILLNLSAETLLQQIRSTVKVLHLDFE